MRKNAIASNFVAVHTYTRAQALADGVLKNASCFATRVGFKHHLAMTSAVWDDCVRWNKDIELVEQSDTQRLWDLLRAAHKEFSCSSNKSHLSFKLLRVPPGGNCLSLVDLILHVGPGDDGESAITIMKPGED